MLSGKLIEKACSSSPEFLSFSLPKPVSRGGPVGDRGGGASERGVTPAMGLASCLSLLRRQAHSPAEALSVPSASTHRPSHGGVGGRAVTRPLQKCIKHRG